MSDIPYGRDYPEPDWGFDQDGPVIIDEPAQNEDELTTWEAIDLGPYLRGEIQQPHPSVGIVRSDGVRLVYPGREHTAMGETESGKSWLAVGCAAVELINDNHVLYLHYEEGDAASTIERLRLLGVPPDVILERLHFSAPSRPVRIEWLEALLDPAPTLVVHDGVNEAMSLHGADIMAPDGAANFRRRLIAPCLKVGAATLACDHVTKSSDGRGRYAMGSGHKLNAIDGAAFMVENVEPFGRGRRGVSHVFVTKDRPGQLRVHGRPTKLPGKTYFGTLVVDDGPLSGPDFLSFFAPPEEDTSTSKRDPAEELAGIVHHVISGLPKQTVTSARLLMAELRKAGHQVRDASVRDAVDDLLVAGQLKEVPGKRGAKGYLAVSTASQLEPEPSASHDRVRVRVPLGEGRGTQSRDECVRVNGTQSDAVGRSAEDGAEQ